MAGRIPESVIDALIYGLSVYGVPTAIGIVTLVAMLLWDSRYDARDSLPLPLAVLQDRDHALSPAQAAKQLSSAQRVSWFMRGFQTGSPNDCDTFGQSPNAR